MKEDRLLRDERDHASETVLGDARDVGAVYGYTTVVEVEEAEDECGDGCLPCAGGADERHFFSRLYFHTEVFQDFSCLLEAEAHIVELDLASCDAQFFRLLRVLYFVRCVQDFYHLCAVGDAFVEPLDDASEPSETSEEGEEVHLDQDEVANGEYPLLPEVDGDIEEDELDCDHEEVLCGADDLANVPCEGAEFP